MTNLDDNDLLINFPDGYQKQTKNINFKKAKELSLEFLKKYTDIEGYELNYDESALGYKFNYIKYVNDIEVEQSYISMDKFGNVYMFAKQDYLNKDVELPNYEDSFYIEEAKECYSNWVSQESNWRNRNIRELKDFKIDNKKLYYHTEYQTYVISVDMSWTTILNDESEQKSGNRFYYPLNQK